MAALTLLCIDAIDFVKQQTNISVSFMLCYVVDMFFLSAASHHCPCSSVDDLEWLNLQAEE